MFKNICLIIALLLPTVAYAQIQPEQLVNKEFTFVFGCKTPELAYAVSQESMNDNSFKILLLKGECLFLPPLMEAKNDGIILKLMLVQNNVAVYKVDMEGTIWYTPVPLDGNGKN